MASLKNIKIKIQSYKKTGTVTHAMEAVSAVKMRKTQARTLGGRAYAAAALSVLGRLTGAVDMKRHPLMAEAKGKTCFIVITSDKGLAGSLNSAVVRATERELLRLGLRIQDVVMICIGRRGAEHFASRGYDVRERYENIGDDVSEADMRKITSQLIAWHAAGEVVRGFVVYTNFISTFEQDAVIRQMIPITSHLLQEMVAGIRPVKGKYAPASGKASGVAKPVAYTIEPNADIVLDILLPMLLNVVVFHAMLESKASEHSARMVAMKNATDKSKEMAHSYTRVFNRIRQASITAEVSEITSGMEAMTA